MTDRFTLLDMDDGQTAIIDTSQQELSKSWIVILLPVYIWALQPLVDLMNELERKAKVND